MASSRKAEPDLGGDLAAFLSRLVPAGSRLVVGYSGGLDSTVLLHVLAALRGRHAMRLSAVHVHHGLSLRADAWAAHCQSVCEALAVPLQVSRVQVSLAGQGVEAAARQARYRIFTRLDADALLLAQHRDDQAETVLLQLARGASARGMAAMPEARALTPRLRLLRPFLELSRAQLEDYARARGLAWVEDESNLDPSLARNHLRHNLLPELEAALPGLIQTLARAAGQFAEWADLLDVLADADGAAALDAEGLAVARLRALPEPRARNLLRRVLEQAGIQVRRQALVEAARQLRDAAPNAQVRVDFAAFSVLRFQGRVRVVPRVVFAAVPATRLAWQGEQELDLGEAGRLRLRRVQEEGVSLTGERVLLRHRQPGDRLRLRTGQLQRPLKDLLREAGVPPWLRPWLPVLEVDGRIAWVAGLGAAAESRVDATTPGWAISWEPPW